MNAYVSKVFFDDKLFTINFHVINSLSGSKLFVMATDQHKRKYPFNMEKKGEEWRVVHGPEPHAIISRHEKELSIAIRNALVIQSKDVVSRR